MFRKTLKHKDLKTWRFLDSKTWHVDSNISRRENFKTAKFEYLSTCVLGDLTCRLPFQDLKIVFTQWFHLGGWVQAFQVLLHWPSLQERDPRPNPSRRVPPNRGTTGWAKKRICFHWTVIVVRTTLNIFRVSKFLHNNEYKNGQGMSNNSPWIDPGLPIGWPWMTWSGYYISFLLIRV